jgi:hypothetical protein
MEVEGPVSAKEVDLKKAFARVAEHLTWNWVDVVFEQCSTPSIDTNFPIR